MINVLDAIAFWDWEFKHINDERGRKKFQWSKYLVLQMNRIKRQRHQFLKNNPSVFRWDGNAHIPGLLFAGYLFIIVNDTENLLVLNISM